MNLECPIILSSDYEGVEVNHRLIISCLALLLITQWAKLLLCYFQVTFLLKKSYAAINFRMTVNDMCEGIWTDAMVACFVLPENGRHRLQRMPLIIG